jgi:signal transduction histidine kinase
MNTKKSKKTEPTANIPKNISIKRGVHFFYRIFIEPKSKNEDEKRKELILNIILSGLIFLLFACNLGIWYQIITGEINATIKFSALELFTLLSFFAVLLFLSRKVHFIISSYIIILTLYSPITYGIHKWGATLPQGILAYALIIIMSGILISSRFIYIITSLISLPLLLFAYLQINNILPADTYWQSLPQTMGDTITSIVIYFIIALLCWLYAREIEKSLKRARTAEAEIKKERDNLEIKVIERTEDLRKEQLERVGDMYRFAEMGRLAGGLFHDLSNPMTGLGLAIENIKNRSEKLKGNDDVEVIKRITGDAFTSIQKVSDFLKAANGQLKKQEVKEDYWVNGEIKNVMLLLGYKAQKNQVEIISKLNKDILAHGNRFKVFQILNNLVSNAIDACADKPALRKITGEIEMRKIEIRAEKTAKLFRLEVEDWGMGIPRENLDKIFTHFFTTKSSENGSGLGLAVVRSIVNDLHGEIKVGSVVGEGTTFVVEIPLAESQETKNKSQDTNKSQYPINQ